VVSFRKEERYQTMAELNIFKSIKETNAPYTLSATTLSFQVPGGWFSYNFQTSNWVEHLADGSFHIVTAEYVRQMIGNAVSKTQSA
jgi:hypothetical protein